MSLLRAAMARSTARRFVIEGFPDSLDELLRQRKIKWVGKIIVATPTTDYQRLVISCNPFLFDFDRKGHGESELAFKSDSKSELLKAWVCKIPGMDEWVD